jgi:hypothetical protein
MSSISGVRSGLQSCDRLEAKDFARTESRRENTAAVCRGVVVDLGALIRNVDSPRVAAMPEARDAQKILGKAFPSGVRARFRARDGPDFDSR